MPKYYLTVGLKYKHEEHPFGLHPDYYYLIESPDYCTAFKKVSELLGNRWARIYREGELMSEFFKGGELPFPLVCMKYPD